VTAHPSDGYRHCWRNCWRIFRLLVYLQKERQSIAAAFAGEVARELPASFIRLGGLPMQADYAD
jgi:hypothetical protein